MSGLPRTLSKESLFSLTSDAPCSEVYNLGDRVKILGDERLGTVAFAGNTGFASGTWVGVILDKSEGKNDGSVNGVRYFECSPKCGLFCRPAKLAKLVSNCSPSASIGVSSPTPSIANSHVTLKHKSIYAQDCGYDVGERVVIPGGKMGVVKFLDRIGNEVLAGILLDRPLGTCDGTYNGVRYFKANPLYGTYVAAEKVKKMASAKPSKVAAVRHTKTSAMRQWRGSQESLNSIGVSSTCSSMQIRSSPKFSMRLYTAQSPSINESDMIAGLKTCLQEKEAHLEHLSKELDQQKMEIERLNTTKSVSSKDELNQLKAQLATSEQVIVGLQTQIYAKENQIEELLFSLDEAEVMHSADKSILRKGLSTNIEPPSKQVTYECGAQTDNHTKVDVGVEAVVKEVKPSQMNFCCQTEEKQIAEFGGQAAKYLISEMICQTEPKEINAAVETIFVEQKATSAQSACQTESSSLVDASTTAYFELEKPVTQHFSSQTRTKKFCDISVEAVEQKAHMSDCFMQTAAKKYADAEIIACIEPEKPSTSHLACQTINGCFVFTDFNCQTQYSSEEKGSQTRVVSKKEIATEACIETVKQFTADSQLKLFCKENSDNCLQALTEPEKTQMECQTETVESSECCSQTAVKQLLDAQVEAFIDPVKPAITESHCQTNSAFTKNLSCQTERRELKDVYVEVDIMEERPMMTELGSQTTVKKFSDMGVEAKLKKKWPDTAHLTCQSNANQEMEHRESQSAKKKLRETLVQSTLDPLQVPEVTKKLALLEDQNSSLWSSLQQTHNQKVKEATKVTPLKSSTTQTTFKKSPPRHKEVVELDISKLNFVNGISSWEEKYKVQTEKVEQLDSAVSFLNSIISEQNATISKLKIELFEKKEEDEGIEPNIIAKKEIKLRSYCDSCEVFDQHETSECPLEAARTMEMQIHTVHSPGAPFSVEGISPTVEKVNKKTVYRPFCDSCEVFGHETIECTAAKI